MGAAILIATSSDELHDLAFARAPARPRVAYLGAASGDDARYYQHTARRLGARYGAEVAHARLLGLDADAHAAAARLIADADVVYLSGGDVWEGARAYSADGVDAAVRAAHAAGATLIGSSAGAINLARGWLRYPDDDNDLTRPTRYACIGAVDLLVDCHSEDDDWSELRDLVGLWAAAEPAVSLEAYGIPSDGLIVVDAAGKVEPLGGAPKRLRLERGRIIEETL